MADAADPAGRGRLTAALDASPDRHLLVGPDGTLEAHAGGARFLTLGEDAVGRPLAASLPPEIGRLLADTAVGVGTAGVHQRLELPVDTPDGRVVVEARLLPAGNGRVLIALRDVTARRRAEDERRRAHTLLAAIIEHSPSMIFVKDAADLRFVLFNRAGETLIGRPRDALLGRSDHELFPRAQAEFFTMKDRAALATDGVLEIEEEPLRTAHGTRHLRTRKVAIPDETGAPRWLLGISEDVTERTELARRLLRAQKLEALGTLAGGIAHDVNNVLTAVIGFAELAELTDDPAERRECLERIARAGLRGRALTDQVLAFGRRTELLLQPTDLAAVVLDAVDLARPTLPAGVAIATDLAHLPPVDVDAAELHRVVTNLLANAGHAMDGIGGTIAVELVGTADGPRLVVRDTGCGMDDATAAQMFDPFFTTRPPGRGTGLGLSVVHGVVTAHGGRIDVQSAPNRGTTITIQLPAATAEPPAAVVQEAAPHGRGEEILFVDDDPELADLGARLLGVLGYRGTGIARPDAALDAVRAAPARWALVISDVTMPPPSGLALTAAIHAIRPGLPVLLCTGYGNGITPDDARRAGAAGLLMKPLALDDLGRAVWRTLAAAA